MKKENKYFLIGILTIIFSSPLARLTCKIIYTYIRFVNLAGSYLTILIGFIVSYIIAGILVFCLGLVEIFKGK